MIFYNKKFLNVAKKILVLFLVFGISFSGIGAHQTEAVLGVGDIVSDPLNTVQGTITAISTPVTAVATPATTAVTAAEFTWSGFAKNTLDYIAYAAAQKLLTQLTNSTLKWIQGGFHGSPTFEVDTDQIFTEIADEMAGNLVLRLRGIASCEFTATYKDDLANSVYKAPGKRDYIFDNQATCPFRQNWNFTATEFYGGLNKLTWDAYGAMLDDGGNPYGLQTITAKELERKTADAQAKRTQETSWSNGFTSIRDLNDCTYPPELFTTKEQILSDSLTDEEKQTLADAENANLRADPEFARKNQQHCKITTPGKIVGDQLTKTLGVDMDRIGFADNINKIISAFLDQVMQKTVRGVFGKGNKSYSSGSIGDPLGNSGGAIACPVQVATIGATPSSDGARISGSVTCADNVSNANVSVWFKWSDEPFVGNTRFANRANPSPDILHDRAIGQAEPFSVSLTGLTPGKTYYYSANAETSQPFVDSQVYGVVKSFTVPLSAPTQ